MIDDDDDDDAAAEIEKFHSRQPIGDGRKGRYGMHAENNLGTMQMAHAGRTSSSRRGAHP